MTPSSAPVACIGCGAMVPDLPEQYGPAHQYIGASPGCWHIYGKVSTKEFITINIRGLLVDTYMVQHPGLPSRQSIQSVARHLLGLYWTLERDLPFDKAKRAMSRAPVDTFSWLDPPSSVGPLTIMDIAQISDEKAAVDLIRQWATTTWEAWSQHQQTIRNWAVLSFS